MIFVDQQALSERVKGLIHSFVERVKADVEQPNEDLSKIQTDLSAIFHVKQTQGGWITRPLSGELAYEIKLKPVLMRGTTLAGKAITEIPYSKAEKDIIFSNVERFVRGHGGQLGFRNNFNDSVAVIIPEFGSRLLRTCLDQAVHETACSPANSQGK